MKKKLFTTIAFLFAIYISNAQVLPNAPVPMNHISDMSSILTNTQRDILEGDLDVYKSELDIDIFIVTFDSLCGYTSKTFAKKLQKKWNLSPKKLKRTAFIFIKPTGNAGERYLYIAVSKDLESSIPDAVLSDIADKLLIPNLKNKEYFNGFLLATRAIKTAVIKINK